MKKIFSMTMLSLFWLTTFVFTYARADETVVAPADFFAQVMQFVHDFGGLSSLMKISGVIMLIIASMKVSGLNDLIWAKLGAAQAWVAPLLGLIGGILGLGQAGPITAASVFAWVSAGAGAVFLHEILDSVKAIPGIGQIYVTIINLIEGALGGPSSKQLK